MVAREVAEKQEKAHMKCFIAMLVLARLEGLQDAACNIMRRLALFYCQVCSSTLAAQADLAPIIVLLCAGAQHQACSASDPARAQSK